MNCGLNAPDGMFVSPTNVQEIYAASSFDEPQGNPEIRPDLFHGFLSGVNLTEATERGRKVRRAETQS